jgi:citrate lyase subunit beta/citryl-CoA lyase
MTIRSWLFVPGDSDKKLGKADDSGSDAIILDIEDSVAPDAKPEARRKVRAFLDSRPVAGRQMQLWVRINPLDDNGLLDLASVIGGAPDGIMVPKIDGPADVLRLSYYLDAFEARDGIRHGSIGILPVATETPAAALNLSGFASAKLPRLVGLTWGAEDLSSVIGARTNRNAEGNWAFTYQMLRSTVLLAAKSAGVEAIETLYADFRDDSGLRISCRSASQEGFTGRIAIHPAQVSAINECFAPSEADLEYAYRVIKAFEASPDTGVVGLDGKMLDMPHLKQARQVTVAAQSFVRRD